MDYLSIDSDFGTVSQIYRESGKVTSPMGCRAYLSPWKDPETNEYVTVSRANIGAVSLNLPLIWEVAQYEHPESVKEYFFKELERNMLIIRKFLLRRYETLANTDASTNPLSFTQGGQHNGFKKWGEKIGNCVDHMTASFGITALHELTELAVGKSLKEDKSAFAKEVVQFIYDKVQEYKREDGRLFALYGTPAESLARTQSEQYRAYLDSIGEHERAKKVPEYFTNSFHLHVSEDISPFEKQDAEFDLFHMIEGGERCCPTCEQSHLKNSANSVEYP